MMSTRRLCKSFFAFLFFLYLGGAVYFYVQTEVAQENAHGDEFDPEVYGMIERQKKQGRHVNHNVEIEYDEKFLKEINLNDVVVERDKAKDRAPSRHHTMRPSSKMDRHVAIRLGVSNIIQKVNVLRKELDKKNKNVKDKLFQIKAKFTKSPFRHKDANVTKENKRISGNKFGQINKGVQILGRKNMKNSKTFSKFFYPRSESFTKTTSTRIQNVAKGNQNFKLPKKLQKYQCNFRQILPAIYFYSAFLDTRDRTKFIRLVTVTKSRKQVPTSVWCHFSIIGSHSRTVSSKVSFYETCENHLKDFAAYIGSCEVPGSNINTSSVIISGSSKFSKEEENVPLKIIYNNPRGAPGKFAVCVPPLFGDINILRLTEFLEFTRILGAEHFTFYLQGIEGDIKKLLEYYENLGIVTLLPWSLPVEKDKIWYHGQSAAVWDCLYRNMFLFNRVAFIDFDEFIIPQYQNTWGELLAAIQIKDNIDDENISAYRFVSAFFDPDFPDDKYGISNEESQLVSLNLTMRTEVFSSIRTKLLVDPKKIFELGIHHVSKPFKEEYRVQTIDSEFAYIHHYRTCDRNWGMDCDHLKKDTSALRYKSLLLSSTKQQLQQFNKLINKEK